MLRKGSWNAESEAGFTLLEIIVVLTLISLLAGLAYPMGNILKERILVKLSLAQLKDDWLELQAHALGGGGRPVLVFPPGTDYYLIHFDGLSLKRPLAGLTIDAESEKKIVFSGSDPVDSELTLRTATGDRYHLTSNARGEPVFKPND